MESFSENYPQYDGDNSKITAKRKATILSQALPYIKKFNNKVVVVKLGGSALTDKNLISSLRALNKKTLNSFNAFEKKAIKNLKFNRENDIAKIKKLRDMLFPNNQLQERHENFISMYLKFGDNFIKNLFSSLNPLDPNFVILELESK